MVWLEIFGTVAFFFAIGGAVEWWLARRWVKHSKSRDIDREYESMCQQARKDGFIT